MIFKKHLIAIVCTALFTTASAINAQDSSTPPAGAAAAEAAKLDPDTINKFAEAHSALLSIRQDYSLKFSSATNQQEAQAIQSEAQEKMVETLEEKGLSVNQYNEIVALLQNNPQLSERVFGKPQPAPN